MLPKMVLKKGDIKRFEKFWNECRNRSECFYPCDKPRGNCHKILKRIPKLGVPFSVSNIETIRYEYEEAKYSGLTR